MVSSRLRFRTKKAIPYLLCLPSLGLLVFILLYPVVYNINLSFYDWSFINPAIKQFVGLRNYVELLTSDPVFWGALRVTFTFVVGCILVEFCIGLAAGLLLNSVKRGRRVLTACLIMPYMGARLAVGLTWKLLWAHDYGLVNYFLNIIGIDSVPWLGSSSTALFAVMISEIWRSTPFVTLVLLAALSALPQEPFEAARVDGASAWQAFRHITFPLLIPPIGVALMFQTIFKMRVFDLIFIMTEGGPKHSTLPLGRLIYRTYFKYYEGGYSAAIASLMLLMGLFISIVYLKLILGRE